MIARLALPLALVAGVLAPPVALATSTSAPAGPAVPTTLSAGVDPGYAGTPTAPAHTAMSLRLDLQEGDVQANPWSTLSFTLPPAVVALAPPSSCDAAATARKPDTSACPVIGSGTAAADIGTAGQPRSSGADCSAQVTLLQGASAPLVRITTGPPACMATFDFVVPATLTPADGGGLALGLAMPDEDRHQLGLDITWRSVDLRFADGFGLTGCPDGGRLPFAARTTYESQTSPPPAVDAAAVASCAAAPPVAVQPAPPATAQVTPAFTLRRSHGRWRLVALAALRGAGAGTVDVRCDAGCGAHRRPLGRRTIASAGGAPRPLVVLHPALRVSSRTRITVRYDGADGSRYTQRFRFAAAGGRLVARGVPSGS